MEKEKKGIPLPGWLFLALMAVYDELLLHLWTAKPFMADRLLVVALLALAFGALMGFVISLFPAKAGKWIAFGVSLLLAVLYVAEYFIDESFQVFMPLSVMLAGAGGVATSFLDTVIALLLGNWWRIGLMLLPIVLYAVFARPVKTGWKMRGILAAVTVALYILAFVVINCIPGYALGLTSAYEFDSAVGAFGLNVALPLDLFQSSEAGQAPSFEVPEATEPPTEVPTEAPAIPEETEAPTEPPVVYEEQVLPIDFTALAESETNANVASIHSYVASQTPSMENEYTGLFEGKNLILITAEAFTAEVIDPERTPALYRMATEGIQFTDYYQPVWGAGTTGGEFTNVVGLVPNGGSCMYYAISQDFFLTMGNQLQELGYSSAAYHNNDYTYYSRNKTHEHLGYDYFMGYGNGIEEGVTPHWPESDLEMFEYTIPKHLDQQPFSLYYMTVSGHSSYSTQYNDMSRKHIDEVADLPYSGPVKAYLAANMELEYSMAYLIEQLEEAGIADDTVVVIAADHYPYGLEQSTAWGTSAEYLTELFGADGSSRFVRDHNALIIWSGCLEELDIVVDDPVFSLDILPTLSNLFGVKFDSRLLPGRDVFSEVDPLVFWTDYSWKTDKGTYSGTARTFTSVEGVEVEEGYVDRISAIVRNKITYSRSTQIYDYFDYVASALEESKGVG